MANNEHVRVLYQGVDTWNRWRLQHPHILPDLTGVDLYGRVLIQHSGCHTSTINLAGAHMPDAIMQETVLDGADLRGANLAGAFLLGASLEGANLADAIFDEADLIGVNLTGANLSGASMMATKFDDVTLVDIDLSTVRGLDTVRHKGPSEISISTLYKSKGNITEIFLRGCGLSDRMIDYIPSLLNDFIQFYSCFISYSSKDQEFAERLHADLQAKGVRVWFAPHDLPIGARIRPAIDESIRVHDKLLLVLSEASVSSQWVEQEVETAFSREREQEGRTVLFPIRIDDAVMEIKSGWPALLKNTRNVGDFTRWKDHDSYSKAFERLLRDLKAGA